MSEHILNLAVAFDCLDQDAPVSPVASDGARAKEPLTKHGYKDATIDEHLARLMFKAHKTAFVAVPTSADTIVVLDVDGSEGRESLAALCRELRVDDPADLTDVRTETPSGGLHFYFHLSEGEVFRNRAKDIGPGLDTRGVKEDGTPAGYVIVGGNRRADGKVYRHIGKSTRFADAAPLRRQLLYKATFKERERLLIQNTPKLWEAINDSPASDWCAIMAEHLERDCQEILRRMPPADGDAIRRQALSDLQDAANVLTAMRDGRRDGLWRLACRVGKYVAHAAVNEAEFRSAFLAAARANGSLVKYGPQWAHSTISRALQMSRHDPLPPIANRFRYGVAA